MEQDPEEVVVWLGEALVWEIRVAKVEIKRGREGG